MSDLAFDMTSASSKSLHWIHCSILSFL